jgi:hypothetical protein
VSREDGSVQFRRTGEWAHVWLCCVVLFCRAMGTQHGSLERSASSNPFTSPLGCILQNSQITMLSLPLPQLFAALRSSSQLLQALSWPVQTPHSACSTPVQTLNSPRCALGGLPCPNPLPRTRTDYSTWGARQPVRGSRRRRRDHGTINPPIAAHQNGTGFLYCMERRGQSQVQTDTL